MSISNVVKNISPVSLVSQTKYFKVYLVADRGTLVCFEKHDISASICLGKLKRLVSKRSCRKFLAVEPYAIF